MSQNITNMSEAEAVAAVARQSIGFEARIGTINVAIPGTPAVVGVPCAVDNNGRVTLVDGLVEAAKKLHGPTGGLVVEMDDIDSLARWIVLHAKEGAEVYTDSAAIWFYSDKRRFNVASMEFERSQALLSWSNISGMKLTAEQFSNFIEDHIDEVVTSDVVTFSRNFEVDETTVWKRKVDASGRVKMVSETSGGASVGVPKSFSIAVPVFRTSPELTELTVRLSVVMEAKKPVISMRLVGVEEVIAEAVRKHQRVLINCITMERAVMVPSELIHPTISFFYGKALPR